MQGEQMISALIGLVGAVSNNGRTEHTDGVIRRAFLQIRNGGSEQEIVEAVHQEKFHRTVPYVRTHAETLRIMIWPGFMKPVNQFRIGSWN